MCFFPCFFIIFEYISNAPNRINKVNFKIKLTKFNYMERCASAAIIEFLLLRVIKNREYFS